MRALTVLVLAGALAGCSSLARISTQLVNIPVAVPCAGEVSPAPAYPDGDEAIRAASAVGDIFGKMKIILAGRALRIAREAELEAALSGCDEIVPIEKNP